jgi:hypothetical protein
MTLNLKRRRDMKTELSVKGIYKDGHVHLLEKPNLDKPYLVTITFVRELLSEDEALPESLVKLAAQRRAELSAWVKERRIEPESRDQALHIIGIAGEAELPSDASEHFRDYLYGTTAYG